jgi:hypothetical protein
VPLNLSRSHPLTTPMTSAWCCATNGLGVSLGAQECLAFTPTFYLLGGTPSARNLNIGRAATESGRRLDHRFHISKTAVRIRLRLCRAGSICGFAPSKKEGESPTNYPSSSQPKPRWVHLCFSAPLGRSGVYGLTPRRWRSNQSAKRRMSNGIVSQPCRPPRCTTTSTVHPSARAAS